MSFCRSRKSSRESNCGLEYCFFYLLHPVRPPKMHFSAPLVLASLFSLSHALPQLGEPAQALPGRLPVSYNQPTYRTYSHKSGGVAAEVKASQPFTIKAYNSVSPIHMMDIVASNRSFFVGNMTGSLCPIEVGDCPVGNVTALQVTRKGEAQLVSPCSSRQPSRYDIAYR